MDYKVNTKKLNIIVKDTTQVLCLLLCLVVFIPKDIHTQETPYLDWVKTYGSNNPGGIEGGGATNLKIGKDNDLYVIGGFTGSINYGDGEPEADFTTEPNETKWFIIKYDSTSNFQWGNTFSGGDGFRITGLQLDEDDNIYIAGSLMKPTDFHFDENEEFILTPSQGNNSSNRRTPFIAKYDNSGNLIWGHTLGVSSSNTSFGDITSLSISSKHNHLLISGYFNDTINVSTGGNNHYLISHINSATKATVFYAQYDLQGGFILGDHFFINIEGNIIINPIKSTIDTSGNFYLTGAYTGDIYFDSDSLTPLLSSQHNETDKRDLFIASFDKEANFQWSSSINRDGALGINFLTTSEDRLIRLSFCDDSLLFRSNNYSEWNFYKNKGICISQWDIENGEFLFVNSIQCFDSIYCSFEVHGFKTDLNGNQYVTGWFSGSMDFDPNPNQEYILTSSMSSSGTFHIRDIFVAKYTPEGELMWAFNLSCDYNINTVGGLDFSHGNFPIIAGSFVGNHNFNPHFNEPHYIQASNSLNGDMFIAKYNFEVEEEIIDIQSIQLFPNPSTDKHKIELKGYSKQSLKVNLYDIQGRLLGNVYDGIIDGQHQILEFDVSRLSSGVYLYDVRLETERKALRFIKQ
jgi:hypothetical protein